MILDYIYATLTHADIQHLDGLILALPDSALPDTGSEFVDLRDTMLLACLGDDVAALIAAARPF